MAEGARMVSGVCPIEVKPGVVSTESLRDGKTMPHQEDHKNKAELWR